MTALELIDQIRAGDGVRDAQDQLFRLVRDALLTRVEARIPASLRARTDADDVIHRAFLRAMDRLSDFHAPRDQFFFAWVFTIARNMLNDDERRWSSGWVSFARGNEAGGPRESRIASSDTRASVDVLRRDLVEKLLSQLSSRQAEIIRMRALDGKSFSEIARSWGSSETAVRRYYSRAVKRLQELAAKGEN